MKKKTPQDVSDQLTDTLEETAELAGCFVNVQAKLDGKERQWLRTHRRRHHLVLRCVAFLPKHNTTPSCLGILVRRFVRHAPVWDAPYWGPGLAPPPPDSAGKSSGSPRRRGSRHRRDRHSAATGGLRSTAGTKASQTHLLHFTSWSSCSAW